jgi:hypothetical protein
LLTRMGKVRGTFSAFSMASDQEWTITEKLTLGKITISLKLRARPSGRPRVRGKAGLCAAREFLGV